MTVTLVSECKGIFVFIKLLNGYISKLKSSTFKEIIKKRRALKIKRKKIL